MKYPRQINRPKVIPTIAKGKIYFYNLIKDLRTFNNQLSDYYKNGTLFYGTNSYDVEDVWYTGYNGLFVRCYNTKDNLKILLFFKFPTSALYFKKNGDVSMFGALLTLSDNKIRSLKLHDL